MHILFASHPPASSREKIPGMKKMSKAEPNKLLGKGDEFWSMSSWVKVFVPEGCLVIYY